MELIQSFENFEARFEDLLRTCRRFYADPCILGSVFNTYLG